MALARAEGESVSSDRIVVYERDIMILVGQVRKASTTTSRNGTGEDTDSPCPLPSPFHR